MGRIVKEIAMSVLGEEALKNVWGRVEIIGDIAVLRKSPKTDIKTLKALAEELLRRLPYVRSVWAAISPVSGTFRTREYVHLAGEKRTLTTYKEHGCVFKVDIAKTYISPTLNYEHIRVARLVRNGEFVINMFAGVGTFSIIIAKQSRPSKVVSIDINPYAYELMRENVYLNKVNDIVEPVLGEAGEVIERYYEAADRVLMPLPELAYRYLPKALKALKGRGFIHVYDFVSAKNRAEAVRKAREKYLAYLSMTAVHADIAYARVVRSVGPHYYQVVLDIDVKEVGSPR